MRMNKCNLEWNQWIMSMFTLRVSVSFIIKFEDKIIIILHARNGFSCQKYLEKNLLKWMLESMIHNLWDPLTLCPLLVHEHTWNPVQSRGIPVSEMKSFGLLGVSGRLGTDCFDYRKSEFSPTYDSLCLNSDWKRRLWEKPGIHEENKEIDATSNLGLK